MKRRRHILYSHVGPPGKRIRVVEFTAGRFIGVSLTFWHDQDRDRGAAGDAYRRGARDGATS